MTAPKRSEFGEQLPCVKPLVDNRVQAIQRVVAEIAKKVEGITPDVSVAEVRRIADVVDARLKFMSRLILDMRPEASRLCSPGRRHRGFGSLKHGESGVSRSDLQPQLKDLPHALRDLLRRLSESSPSSVRASRAA